MRRNNVYRARKLATALKKWHSCKFENDKTRIVDLLVDIRHLCDLRGLDFAALDFTAAEHYNVEYSGLDLQDPNFVK